MPIGVCRCPTCHGELFITCDNGCPDAAEGVAVPPGTPAPRVLRRAPGDYYSGARGETRRDVLAALAEATTTMRPSAVARLLGLPVGRVDEMCRKLYAEGLLFRVMPHGLTRGVEYSLKPKRNDP